MSCISAIATGHYRGDQGRHERMHHLRSRDTMLTIAVIIVAGSLLFIIQYVIIIDHAVVDHGVRPGESRVDLSGLPSTVVLGDDTKRLAVVVPTFDVDLPKALHSLVYWPTTCYQTTLQNMDFVLYYAGGAEDMVSERFLSRFAETGGRCFARTRIVLGNLTDEVSPLTKHEYIWPQYWTPVLARCTCRSKALGRTRFRLLFLLSSVPVICKILGMYFWHGGENGCIKRCTCLERSLI